MLHGVKMCSVLAKFKQNSENGKICSLSPRYPTNDRSLLKLVGLCKQGRGREFANWQKIF